MKKILSIIMAALMLSCTAAVTASASGASRETVIETMEMLQLLGIVQEEYNSNNFNPDQVITRADFAVYFSKLMNIETNHSDVLYYTDVPKNHYAFDAITVMTEKKYLNGTGSKTFEPDAKMDKQYAHIALIKALGYDFYSELSAEIQMSIMNSKEILKGTSAGSTLTLNDLILMMKNTLLASTAKITGIRNGAPVWEDGDSLLYVTRKMEYVERQTVTGAKGTTIYGTSIGTDRVVIGKTTYKTSIYDIFDYIGSKVDYIYKEADYEDDNEVVWLQKKDSENELFLDRSNDIEYDKINNCLTYYDESGRKKTAKLSTGIAVIYNGKFAAAGYSDIFSAPSYEVTLRKTNSNTEWDLAVVWEYENRFVSGTDINELLLYDSLTQSSLSFDPGEYDICEILNSAGEPAAFEDIAPKNIISTYISKDGRCLKAIISTNVVTGAYTSFSPDKGVAVDNKFYEFFDESIERNYSGVKSLTLYLDYKGYIGKEVKSYVGKNQFVGYVFKFAHYTEADEMLALRVLSEDGKVSVYKVKEKLNVDGVKYTNLLKAYDAVAPGKTFTPQLMCLTLDGDGFVTRIDRTAENGGTGDVIRQNSKQPTMDEAGRWEAVYYSQAQSAGLNMLIGPETTVFYVPDDADIDNSDDRDFGIGVPANNDDFRSAVSYATTPEEVFWEQYVVLKQSLKSTPLSEYDGFFLVDSVIETLDDDGLITKSLVGMQQGNTLTLQIDEDIFDFFGNSSLADIKSGDIIRVSYKNGIIRNASIVYSYGSGVPVSIEADSPAATERFVSGYVYSKDENIFKLRFENSTNAWDQITNMNGTTGYIMVYDSNSRGTKVSKGSVADMKTYTDSGNGSFIVMQTRYMRCLGLVIYK